MSRTISLCLALCFLLSVTIFASAQRRPDNDPWIYGPNARWDATWNNRPMPRAGACFFTDRNFRGNRFCVRGGDRIPSLPGGFGNNISSIQLFGRARARIFNDRDFRGGSAEIRGSVADLRRHRFPGGHTWNNRISSIVVR